MNARLFALVIRYYPETGNLYWLMDLGTRARVGMVAGNTGDHGYKFVKINGISYSQHRLAWLLMTGDWPEFDIDHIDGNGSNNVWKNLRDVTTSTNCKNSKIRNDNSSGIVGVSLDKRSGKWLTQFTLCGIRYNKSGFNSKAEAKAFRDAAISSDNSYHENHGRLV